MSKSKLVSELVDKMNAKGQLKIALPIICDYGVIHRNSFRMMLSRSCRERGIVVVTHYDEEEKTLHIFKVK